MRFSEEFVIPACILGFIFGCVLIILFTIFCYRYIDHLYPSPFDQAIIKNGICADNTTDGEKK